jgi:Ser/Thr protein kinase RdoA (MazF antagonist)
VPGLDDLRSVLRDQWHLTATRIEPRPGSLLSRVWDVDVGEHRYVCRLAGADGRAGLEAALAAAQPAGEAGVEVGRPVRTLNGRRTAVVEAGVLAVSDRVPGRPLAGGDPVDQQFWGDRLGALHRVLHTFHHPGLRSFQTLDPYGPHLALEPWLRPAVVDAISATIRLTVTDRLTYGVLHGDPAPGDFVVDPGTGRAGLLDCGIGRTGPLVYDVAAAVAYAGGPDHAAELLDGYLAAGPVPADELHAALPVLLRFRWAVQADRAAREEDRAALAEARAALESMPGSP